MKVEVRKGFVVWINPQKHYTEEEQFEVTEEIYQKISHQVEPVATKRTRSTNKETSE